MQLAGNSRLWHLPVRCCFLLECSLAFSAGAVPDPAEHERSAVEAAEYNTDPYLPAHGRNQPCSSDSVDLLAFANLRVFGNRNFRHQQRAVIEAVLEVGELLLVSHIIKNLHLASALGLCRAALE